MGKDYYQILQLSRDATSADIKKAYHRLSRTWHPDKNPGNEAEARQRFQDISEAYQVLIDSSTRRQYDMSWNCDGADLTFKISPEFFKAADELFREIFDGLPLEEILEQLMNDQYFTGNGSTRMNFSARNYDSQPRRRNKTRYNEGMEGGSNNDQEGESDHEPTDFENQSSDIHWQLVYALMYPVFLLLQTMVLQIMQQLLLPFQPLLQKLQPVHRLLLRIQPFIVTAMHFMYRMVICLINPTHQLVKLLYHTLQSIFSPIAQIARSSTQMFSQLTDIFKSVYQTFQAICQLPLLIKPVFELIRVLLGQLNWFIQRAQFLRRRA